MLVLSLFTFIACDSSSKSTSTAKASYLYVGSSNSDKYHIPSCEWAKKIKYGNLVKFTSKQDAENKGYEACKVCKP